MIANSHFTEPCHCLFNNCTTSLVNLSPICPLFQHLQPNFVCNFFAYQPQAISRLISRLSILQCALHIVPSCISAFYTSVRITHLLYYHVFLLSTLQCTLHTYCTIMYFCFLHFSAHYTSIVPSSISAFYTSVHITHLLYHHVFLLSTLQCALHIYCTIIYFCPVLRCPITSLAMSHYHDTGLEHFTFHAH